MFKAVWPAIIALVILTEGRGAPLPKGEGKLTTEVLTSSLGKSHLSREIQEIRKAIGEKPVATYSVIGTEGSLETGFYHSFYDQGLSMRFDDQGLLEYMHLYVEPSGGFKNYKGELPDGLKAGDKPAELKKKLGDPSETQDGLIIRSSNGIMGASWKYSKKGMEIHYSTVETDDAKAVVATIVLYAPEK